MGLEDAVSNAYILKRRIKLTFCRREPDERADPAEVLCTASETSVAMVLLEEDDLAVPALEVVDSAGEFLSGAEWYGWLDRMLQSQTQSIRRPRPGA